MIQPIAFAIGPFAIYWYGILMAIAFLLGYYLTRKFLKEKGYDIALADGILVSMLIGTIVGARLGEVFFYNPSYYLTHPLKIFFLWEGGLASHGGIMGALIALYLFSKKNNLPFLTLADILTIPFLLGGVLIRIANFINGEIVGRITTVSWGMSFSGYEGVRHPSQLYEAAQNLFIFIYMYVQRNKHTEGYIFLMSIFLFSFIRFFLEFLKEGVRYYGLATGQWLSLIFACVTGYYMWKLKHSKKLTR